MNYTSNNSAGIKVNYTSMTNDELLARCEALFIAVEEMMNQLHLLHEEISKRVE
jgi:hypothetical protein